ncbi:hypothetical protein P3G55_16705 [Leptospira sp. 96542]|nr:hypothetical protein [Leptospira sp. 96542]
MRALIFSICLFSFYCIDESKYYKKCESAEKNYLLCSLTVYQSYNLCSEQAASQGGSVETKAQAKTICDATRLTGLYVCEAMKTDVCGKK